MRPSESDLTQSTQEEAISDFAIQAQEVLYDYRLAYQSRQASLIGRREVMTGKAKFGIFGDGKELPQLAMAKFFEKGDFRAGYYRDQTFMLAIGEMTIPQLFAQLYADSNVENEPSSAGRQMNAHFATRSLKSDGSWRNLMEIRNSSSDISTTGSQMPRLVGLGLASKLYREIDALHRFTQFSHNGNEVAFGTIGNASTSEGMFWESINAIGVLKAPVIVSIWDDEYGISVTNEHQTTKQNIGEVLKGFQREPGSDEGFDIYTVRGWDYLALLKTYQQAVETARREHIPAIIHVIELTQPQGHSTSGSHERYKSEDRLAWEREYDCLEQFRQWIIREGIATDDELSVLETEDRKHVEGLRKQTYSEFQAPAKEEIQEVIAILDDIPVGSELGSKLSQIKRKLHYRQNPIRSDIMVAIHNVLMLLKDVNTPAKQRLIQWKRQHNEQNTRRYGSHLYSESAYSALKIPENKPTFSANSPEKQGYQILNQAFDAMLARDPRVVAFGEDLGYLGGVNQGFVGLQAKYGENRVADTGIREVTILGQAIGLAMRGLRPIAEIQYLDYLLYALQLMSDDLATVQWRTKGGQKAPVIIRTRGHRLEGVWHSGSPMAGIINLIRGIHVLVPRNMVQAAGFYNTLLLSDEPGLVIEVLNGYRLKERQPDNLSEFTLPLGIPEVMREGNDITLVSYGATLRIVMEAAEELAQVGIDAEVIDVQSLLPFDINHSIVESLKKTNQIAFIDEDVPGGATAYMMQHVIEKQGGYFYLDAPPITITAKEHRPAYGSDGNYWSKPNVETIFERIYRLMHEQDPGSYPIFF